MSQGLYRKVRMMIDIYCVVGIPLALWILINYVVGIIALVMIITVTLLRRRFLDDKTERLVSGAFPVVVSNTEHTGDAARSRTDARPIRVMSLAAFLATCLVASGVVIALANGSPFPWIPVGCVLVVWAGVGLTALGHHFGQRS